MLQGLPDSSTYKLLYYVAQPSVSFFFFFFLPPSLLSHLREIEGPSIPTCILGFSPFPPVINVPRAFKNLSQSWKLQPATRVCTRGDCIFFFFFPAKPELAGMGMNKRGDLKLHGLEGSSG